MLIGGVLLLIDLFLPWQDFGNEFSDAVGVDASFSGWRGVGGVLVGLLTIVLLAWLIVRLASVNVPLPVSTAMTAAIIGTLILIFTVIKLLTILGDEATIWAWAGLALAIVIAVGSFMTVQEAGRGRDAPAGSEQPELIGQRGGASCSRPGSARADNDTLRRQRHPRHRPRPHSRKQGVRRARRQPQPRTRRMGPQTQRATSRERSRAPRPAHGTQLPPRRATHRGGSSRVARQ